MNATLASSAARRAAAALRRHAGRPAARVVTGSIVGQGLVVAASPAITRLYGPADLGALAVVTALSSVVGAVAPLGWDRAIVVPRGETAARLLVASALVSVLVLSTAATVVAFLCREQLADLTGTQVLADAWWVCPVTVALVATQRVVTAWAARRRDYRGLARRNVLQGVGQVVCNLSLAPLGGSLGLVLGVAAGRLAALGGAAAGRGRSRRAAPVLRRGAMRAVIVRYRRFPLVSTWSSLVNVAGQQAPIVLLAAAHGSATLGGVALTLRVLGAPVGMVADAVGLQVEGQLGALVRARQGDLRGSVRRAVARLTVVAVVVAVLVAAVAPSVFPVVFGGAWAGSGAVASIMVPAFAAQVVVSPFSRLLPLLERQGTQLAWDLGRFAATAGAIVVTGLAGADLVVSLAAWSGASLLSYAVLLLLVDRAVTRHTADWPA